MDPQEEQAAELEALEAIFDSDFRITEPASAESGARFEIDLADDVTQNLKLRLIFTHTLSYPETPLSLVVHALEGLSTPKRKLLQTFLEGFAAEHVDMPSAYAVCQAATEWLETNVVGKVEDDNEDEDSKFETLDATQVDKVEVISSKAVGTPVTVESFAEWRERFLEEMEALKTKEQREREAIAKMTGRQFFESKTVVVSAESESFWEQEASQMAASAE